MSAYSTVRLMVKILALPIALAMLCGTATAIPMDFVVDAEDNSSSEAGVGLDTGLFFNMGDIFTVDVDPLDLWNAGPLPRWSNADGLVVDLLATGSDDSGLPAGTPIGAVFPLYTQGNLTAPFGSLVGSIGVGGDFFVIGTSFSGPAPDSGNLLLYYWDSNSFDNTEFITATVDANPVPEPGTWLLIAVGAAALAYRRKRT